MNGAIKAHPARGNPDQKNISTVCIHLHVVMLLLSM